MSVEMILSRLEGVKSSGKNKWRARCPAHGSKGGTLSIAELNDGRVLIHCFAGCCVQDVVQAAGLSLRDLMPEKNPFSHAGSPVRNPFPALDALRALEFELLIVQVCAADMASGKKISHADRDRLALAATRLKMLHDAVEVRR